MEYRKVTPINDLRQGIRKAIEKIDINDVQEVIGAFLRRMFCVEKRESELMIDKHCRFQ